MNYNTQNAKIASITEKTLIVGIDVGSETHYARAFNWRNYEYSKKPLAFSNDEAGFSCNIVIYANFLCSVCYILFLSTSLFNNIFYFTVQS